MTPPTGIERKVRQLDNDVQSIYELLASVSATQNRQANRLDEADQKLDEIDRKLDRVLDLLGGDNDASG